MKRTFLLSALALTAAPLTFAMSAFPNAPEISDPVANEANVGLTATLSTEVMTSTNTDPENYSVEFNGVSWYLSDEFDSSLHLFGGLQNIEPGILIGQDDSYTYQIDPALSIIINDQTVHTLEIRSNGSMDLLSESDETIASVSAKPFGFNMKLSASLPFILVKENGDSVSVRWTFADSSYPSDVTMEAELRSDGTIRILANPSAYDNALYSPTTSDPGAGGSAGVSIPSFSYYQSLPGWKTTYSETVDDFGLEFSFNAETGIVAAPTTPVTIGDFDAPEFVVEEAEGYDHETTLEPFKDYVAYARHRAQIITGDPTTNMISALSAPVFFSTVASDYSISASALPTLTVGESKTFSLTLTNTGTYAGEPQVTVQVPFAVLSGINSIGGSDIETTLNAQIDGGSCNVDVDVSGPTTITCGGVELAVDASVTVTVDLTFANESTQVIAFDVCETLTDDCNSQSLQEVALSVVAAVPDVDVTTPDVTTPDVTTPTPEESPENEGSGSSGGGSSLWLMLLALPLLTMRSQRRLRRTA